jgi:hypothetical protein
MNGILMAGIMTATGLMGGFPDVLLPEPKPEPNEADFERLKKAQEKRDRKATKNLVNKK